MKTFLINLAGSITARLTCWRDGHVWSWRHNYYGDAIFYSGGKRSAWKCTRCGNWQFRDALHKAPTSPDKSSGAMDTPERSFRPLGMSVQRVGKPAQNAGEATL